MCVEEESMITCLSIVRWCIRLVVSFFLISKSLGPFLTISDLTLGWRIRDLKSFPNVIWWALPRAICWGLWKEKNNRMLRIW